MPSISRTPQKLPIISPTDTPQVVAAKLHNDTQLGSTVSKREKAFVEDVLVRFGGATPGCAPRSRAWCKR